MKNEKTWKLRCVNEDLKVEQVEKTTFTKPHFVVTLGNYAEPMVVLKYKSTITAIRKMCDWMEERL